MAGISQESANEIKLKMKKSYLTSFYKHMTYTSSIFRPARDDLE